MKYFRTTILLLAAMCLALTGVAQAATSWDMVTDYTPELASPENIGPDGVWSYLYENATATPLMRWVADHTRYENQTEWSPVFGIDGNTNKLYWHTHTPEVWGAMVRWTAPRNMNVDFTGKAFKIYWQYNGDGRIQDVGITKNGTESLFAGQVTDSSILNSDGTLVNPVEFARSNIAMIAGDYLQFRVARNVGTSAGFIAADWTITETPAKTQAPVISPPGGVRSFSTLVTMTSATQNATIRYTTDGTEPTAASAEYTGTPLFITSSTTVKAKAWSVIPVSDTTVASYVIAGSGDWKVTRDWQSGVLPPVGIGPDGAWSYGEDSAAGEGPFTFVEFTALNGNGWYVGPGGDSFGMGFYTYSQWWPFVNAANSIVMHTSNGGPERPLLILWTAPASFSANVSGKGYVGYDYAGDGGQALRPEEMGLRKNSEPSMWSDISDDFNDICQFTNLAVEVNRGDSLYLWFRPTSTEGFFTCEQFDITPVGGERTATPVFVPDGGGYDTAQSVTMSCADPGAVIKYTTDGSDPSSGTVYSGTPVPITATTTLKAKATAEGLAASATKTAAYSIHASDPIFTPGAGNYNYPPEISISSATAGATIRYTTDGSDPTAGTLYGGPIRVMATLTLKAKAWAPGVDPSNVASAAYTLGTGAVGTTWSLIGDWEDNIVPAQLIGPDAVWSYGQDVLDGQGAFSYAPYDSFGVAATIGPGCYFMTGSIFGIDYRTSAMSLPFNSPADTILMHTISPEKPMVFRWRAPATMTVSTSGKAYVAYDYVSDPNPPRPERIGLMLNDTEIWTATSSVYTEVVQFTDLLVDVNRGDYLYLTVVPTGTQGYTTCESWTVTSASLPRTASPVFNPPSGSYDAPQTVSITCVDPGATIRYTTDGSTPTSSSGTVYGGAINVSSSMTLKAIAYQPGMPDSKVRTATYSIFVVGPAMSMKDIKTAGENESVASETVVITAKFGDTFYVEEVGRNAGIRVDMPGNTYAVGRKGRVGGSIHTDEVTGERYILAGAMTDGGTDSILPVDMTNKALGGGAMGLQLGVSGSAGLNNIGLLVKTTGDVITPGGGIYYVDDGSGVPVKVLASGSLPDENAVVAVTGISSCEKVAGLLSRVIRATTDYQLLRAAP